MVSFVVFGVCALCVFHAVHVSLLFFSLSLFSIHIFVCSVSCLIQYFFHHRLSLILSLENLLRSGLTRRFFLAFIICCPYHCTLHVQRLTTAASIFFAVVLVILSTFYFHHIYVFGIAWWFFLFFSFTTFFCSLVLLFKWISSQWIYSSHTSAIVMLQRKIDTIPKTLRIAAERENCIPTANTKKIDFK